MNLLYFYTFNK